MTTPSQPRRRISSVRFCDPVAGRQAAAARGGSPLVILATVTAAALAVGLLALTISAAQAMQLVDLGPDRLSSQTIRP